jgi:diguanylate cyclase (GGDEF)-like protein
MKKFRVRISSLIAFTFIGSLLLSLLIYQFVVLPTVNDTFYKEAYENNKEIANSAVDFFDAKINGEISSIIGVEVAHHNILEGSPIFDDNYYETILNQNEYIIRLEVLSTDYEVLYSSNQLDNREGLNLANYYLFDDVTDIHQLHIGKLIYDNSTEELALEVAYSGEDVVVTGLISITFFQIYGNEFKETFQNKEVMILTNNGKYLYDSKNDYHLIQEVYPNTKLLLENASNNLVVDILGVESIASTSELEYNNWNLIIYESTESALSSHSIINLYYLLSFIFLFVIVFGLFGVLLYLIQRSLKSLVIHIDELKEGEFDSEDLDSNFVEMNDIVNGFNEMKESIKSQNEKLLYLAYHDALTGLGNRNKGSVDFEKLIQNESFSFAYIDISRFDVINENYGYQIGDEVLVQVAKELKNHFDYLYRIQSDEFLCVKVNYSKDEMVELVEKVSKRMQKGFRVSRYRISLTIHAGLARYPNHSNEYIELLQCARISLNEVKLDPVQCCLCYDDIRKNNYMRLSKIELLISDALLNKEFRTVFQPIVNMKNLSIRGFEALSRWENKELGVVTPDEFIPVLERTHQVHILDEMVLNRSVQLSKFLKDEFGVNLICSVNMSVETIMMDHFTSLVDDVLEKYNFNPNYLEIEITESTIVKDFDRVKSKMSYLANKGVKFSEDDFGDAYSSLTYLTRLDISTLKISKNFLGSILSNVESRILIQTIVDLSHKLGLFTIVEGIEDQSTFELFKEYKCDYCQGYYFYKPMPDQLLIELVSKKEGK